MTVSCFSEEVGYDLLHFGCIKTQGVVWSWEADGSQLRDFSPRAPRGKLSYGHE